jgi:hypothetical protein
MTIATAAAATTVPIILFIVDFLLFVAIARWFRVPEFGRGSPLMDE